MDNTLAHGPYLIGIFLVKFDRFVGLACDETAATLVERHGVDACLAVKRARLDNRFRLLEAISRTVVPEAQAAVVRTRHQHAVLVDGKRVDGRVVPGQVLDELASLAVPFLDVVRRTRDECVPA